VAARGSVPAFEHVSPAAVVRLKDGLPHDRHTIVTLKAFAKAGYWRQSRKKSLIDLLFVGRPENAREED
jgi:hypothetical protein